MDALDFQQRIARAKEAARLASLAVGSRSAAPPAPSAPPAPPDAVRQRIERLVDFVRRNGPAFEAAAAQRERGNPEFAFLAPGAPFHDFYQWRKRQACGVGAPPPPGGFGAAPPPPAETERDPMAALSVGAMANVCRLGRASGVPAYAPVPPEVVANVGSLPPVEPGRLEIRLADFYRSA